MENKQTFSEFSFMTINKTTFKLQACKVNCVYLTKCTKNNVTMVLVLLKNRNLLIKTYS